MIENSNHFVNPLLTDFYQITMSYAYWKVNRHLDKAVFDLFFRKNPFSGEFTIFAGLDEVLKFVNNFHFDDKQIAYIKSLLPNINSEFIDWLSQINCHEVNIYALKEGSIVFPRIPLLRIEGPLGIVQLLETTLLNLINFASLISTNAARYRIAAGKDKTLLEFGLRRAQGPDGAISASHYSYIGGFDGTSNVLAGALFDIPVKGTHAHSFVQSFTGIHDIKNKTLIDKKGRKVDFVKLVFEIRDEMNWLQTNESELTAFIAYAQAFPDGFLALVDTYDTLNSGILNFICVAIALLKLGFKPIGIRLDSGDLAYLSRQARALFKKITEKTNYNLQNCSIVASNDINESVLLSLIHQGHEIDAFGIGTHLVTSQAQPALGGVFKLVEVNSKPRIKISQDISKVTIPGRKEAYRLYGKNGYPLLDLLIKIGDTKPIAGRKVTCQHPFDERKRAFIIPQKVEKLHHLVWNGQRITKPQSLNEIKKFVMKQLLIFRKDHLRPLNPTPYKLSVSDNLYSYMHNLWKSESPIKELK